VKNRFIKNLFPIFLSLVPIFITGCATSPEKSKQPASISVITGPKKEKDPFSGFPERYRLKAREDEKRGDLPKALKDWKVVKSFLPTDAEAADKIEQLNKQIPAAADQHFQKGLALFQNHSSASARKEFLLTLYLKPDHAEAIQYLKEKMAGEDSITYEVKKGDTIKEIARKIYGDPQKGFLIAYFNGLKMDRPIEPPMILKMPFLDPPPAKKTSIPPKMAADPIPEIAMQTKEILGKARTTYQQGNYQECAALTEKILEYDPANEETHKLMNASYYQWGKQLSQEGKYNEALKAFRRVDSGYKDVSLQAAHNRKQLAEAHYKKGVKFFIEEEIEKAIQEWESTLALEPNHPNAKKDIENGRHLLQKLKKIE
jgi:tetratricopeptide (TPR) repeat protein